VEKKRYYTLAIVGMPGAGKSVVANCLVSEDFKLIRFGSFIIEEVKRRNLEVTAENERTVREDLRRKYGMDICAQLALPIIRKYLEQGEKVVIDGLYSLSEYETLRTELGSSLLLIAVFTPRELRYKRLADRPDRPLSAAEAESRDMMEVKNIEKSGPIALSDFILINDQSIDALCDKTRQLLLDLGKTLANKRA